MITAGAITTIRDIKQEKEIAILFQGWQFFLVLRRPCGHIF